MTASEAQAFTVPDEARGNRLDSWLATVIPQQSRSAIQRWIGEGAVRLDGQPTRAAARLEPGQTVTVRPPPILTTELVPEPIPLTIVYEDSDIVVVDKPAGLVVHPAPGHPRGTLVNAILHHCPTIQGVGGEKRPGIVHRLDRETSGLILVAKNDHSHRHLQRQFAERRVQKLYLALLEGVLSPETGRIVAPIGRHPIHRKKMAIVTADGKSTGREAITLYSTAGRYSTRLPGGEMANFTLVEARPQTGRTHQIRVHFAWLRHPLVGDRVYGYRRQRLPAERHFLHAHRLEFTLPDGEEVAFTSPLPPDLSELLSCLS